VSYIRELAQERELYCLVGAGLSHLSETAGIGGWKDILDRLRDELEGPHYPGQDETVANFNKAMAENEFKRAGRAFKESQIDDARKQRAFSDLFLGKNSSHPVHMALMRLGLRGSFTTNYDHKLEDAYARLTGKSLLPLLPHDLEDVDFRFPQDFFLAKLHGDAARWRSVVLGDLDFSSVTYYSKVKALIDREALLVIGIGSQDEMVNNLLISLDRDTRIVMLMSKGTKESYEEKVRGMVEGGVPDHIEVYPVEHDELPDLIYSIRPNRSPSQLFDCPWAEMPPLPSGTLQFGEADTQMRDFLFSDDKTAFVRGKPGRGLSSFLAQALHNRESLGDALVYRLEAKEFLPWDAYLLHLLASMDDTVFEKYREQRNSATREWTTASEAIAVAVALSEAKRPIIIAFEHVERLPDEAWGFYLELLDRAPVGLKLVLASVRGWPHKMPIDCQIVLPRPSEASAKLLCQQRGVTSPVAGRVLRWNPEADLNTIVMAACLLQKVPADRVSVRDSLEELVKRRDSAALCKMALSALENEPNLQKVAKAAALFRKPRSASSLAKCLDITSHEVERAVAALAEYGLVMMDHGDDGDRYAMSTTVRDLLCELLDWSEGEREILSSRVGERFEEHVKEDLDANSRSRAAMCKAIPFLATALFHYREAGDQARYLKLVCGMSEDLQHMYHNMLLAEWLSESMVPGDISALDPIDAFDMAVTQATLQKVNGCPSGYQDRLDSAEQALEAARARGRVGRANEQKLLWHRGVMMTQKRLYEPALDIFQRCVDEADDTSGKQYFRGKFRVVQTLFSLGRLSEAARRLDELSSEVDSLDRLDVESYCHNSSMLHRHRSTLCTLRLLFFGRSKKLHDEGQDCPDEATLLESALEAAQEAVIDSRNLARSPERYEREDVTGVGVAELKMSQAHLAARNHEEAFGYAKDAAAKLTAYPNNRWWRMSSLDCAARSAAATGRSIEAKDLVDQALAIWRGSAQEDTVRRCELHSTTGLIALAEGDLHTAATEMHRSTRFEEHNPCIMATHQARLAHVLMQLGRLDEAEQALSASRAIEIEW